MNANFPLGRQIGDFLTYILLPLLCVLLPFSWGQALIAQVARHGWLLKARSAQALQQAMHYIGVENPQTWQQQWRLVEMMEARDLWLCVTGRAAAVSRHVKLQQPPSPELGLVMLGIHYGPTAIVLQIFQDIGLEPRFVYRSIDSVIAELRRLVPFQWLYSNLNVRYIRQSCRGRDISVPGGRSKLATALQEPGTPVILLDAPVTRTGQSKHVQVLGLEAEFSGEGSQLLIEGGARPVFYWMETSENGERLLRFQPLKPVQSADQLVQEFADLLSQRLAENSAHWRLWHAAGQFFRTDPQNKM